MLASLKAFIDSVLPPLSSAASADPAEAQHRVQLATAVLLVEVMHADTRIGLAERQAALAALRRSFSLNEDESARLIELAQVASHDATDFHAFTSAINERFEMAQKLQVVEAMWQVAYADGRLEAHENHVLWRVADLLHVPHGAYINAKMRAQSAAGAG